MVRHQVDYENEPVDDMSIPVITNQMGDLTRSVTSSDQSNNQSNPNALENVKKTFLVCGVNGLILGLVTVVIGVLQIFGFPNFCTSSQSISVELKLENFYGFTLWCGIWLLILSSTSLRVYITKRRSTFNRYIGIYILTVDFYVIGIAMMGVQLHNYDMRWDACGIASQILGTVFLLLGFLFLAIIPIFTCSMIMPSLFSLAACCYGVFIKRFIPHDHSPLINNYGDERVN